MKIKKTKILVLLGTRPEIIRLSRIIDYMNMHVEIVLVHTGQNYDYELNDIFFSDFKLKAPDYFLDAVGSSSVETVGNIIKKMDKVIDEVCPDALLVLGDTNSCMGAYAAKRKNVPIFHMEAGNRCFDLRVPEEINRKIIDHMSDINLVYSDISRLNLLREGISIDKIIKTGSPMLEVINFNKEKIEKSEILKTMKLEKNGYFVISFHRDENVESDSNFNKFIILINSIAKKYNKPIIFSAHPRTRKKIEKNKCVLRSNIIMMKPLGFFDYIKLEINSFCVLSDSGTISEEASILKFPALNIRESHERNEAMDEGAVIMTGLELDRVMESIEVVTKQKQKEDYNFYTPKDYNIDNVSNKTLRIILSYIDYIKKNKG